MFLKAIIHVGGASTRLRDVFDGPKCLAPIGNYPILWYHLQPWIKSGLIDEYIFTVRYKHELVKQYIERLAKKFGINTTILFEPEPMGRAGVTRYGIEQGLIDTKTPYMMSYPDDFIPIDVNNFVDYSFKANRRGKSLIAVVAKNYINPFGVGKATRFGDIYELETFLEKPELPLIDNHYAAVGMMIFMPEAMEEFRIIPKGEILNPEHVIHPKLARENKVAIYPVERWLSVNSGSEYKKIIEMGHEKLLEYLKV